MLRRLPLFAVAFLWLAASVSGSTITVYQITVDTSSIAGKAGSLDFNFNPGLLVSQSASLQILNFSTGGTLTGTASTTGDVSGTLPSTLTFDNGSGLNDYFQGFTFGSNITFQLGIYGPALSSPDGVSTSGSAFAFSMFSNAAGTTPTLTTDTTNGLAFTININLDGTVTLTNSAGAQATIQTSQAPQTTQTITFGALPSVNFSATPIVLAATSSSGLAVTYSSTTPAVCTVSGNVVTLVSAGTCSITANQIGSVAIGAAAPIARMFTVNPVPQTITFGPVNNQVLGPPIQVSATSTSGLAVAFASNTSSICTVSGTTVTLIAVGTCSITATQPGSSTTAAASPVTQTFTVVPQLISFYSIPNQIFGTAPFPVSAKASSGLTVSLVSTTPSVCRIGGMLVTLVGAGTCSVTASQGGSAAVGAAAPVTQTFTVGLAKPSGTLVPAVGGAFTVLVQPGPLAVGDFNGDGKPDLIVVNGPDGVINVMLGNGSGGFTAAPGSPITVGSVGTVAVGDFNNDGNQDLAATINGGNLIVLLGSGSGGFTPAPGTSASAGSNPDAIGVADFNGDGIQDLAITNYNDFTVTLLIGNGLGGFTATTASPSLPDAACGQMVVGDFNGDGKPDLAFGCHSGHELQLLLGDGADGFLPASGSPFAAGSYLGYGTVQIAVGDFNGDGKLDVALINNTSLVVMSGDGAGGFTAAPGSPFANAVSLPDFGYVSALVAGDFNGDGKTDLLAGNNMFLGNGLTGLVPSVGNPFSLAAAGTGFGGYATGDFNADGRLDLAVAVASGNSVGVLLGATVPSSSVLSTTAPVSAFGNAVPLSLMVAGTASAFNLPTGTVTFADGATTLALQALTGYPFTFSAPGLSTGSHTLTATYGGDSRTAGSASNGISIQVNASLSAQTITFGVLGNVAGSVTPPLSATASSGLPITYTSSNVSVCTVSGVNITLLIPGTCSITASQPGNPGYLPATPVTQSFNVSAASQTIGFAPILNQILGSSPLVLAAGASSRLPVTLSSTTPAICRSASGLVTSLKAGTCSISAIQGGNAVYTAAALTRSFMVTQARTSGILTLAAGSPVTVGSAAVDVAIADYNGDGIPDIATLNGSSNNVSVLLGNGTGGFSPAPGSPFPVGSSPNAIVVGDFNGDGKLDLAVANYYGNSISVLLGNGSGGFAAAPGSPIALTLPLYLAAGDFDGDGNQDLAVIAFSDVDFGQYLFMLRGNGLGGFSAPSATGLGLGGSPIVGDFNSDGKLDLATFDGVLFGNGAGGFTPAASSPFVTSLISGGAFTSGDFNGDGITDLVLADPSVGVTVVLGNAAGGFTAVPGGPFATGLAYTTSMTAGDFNGDGNLDLAFGDSQNNYAVIFLGDGSGGFTGAVGGPFSAIVGSAMVAADLNGDGRLDLAAVGDTSTLTVLLGTAASTNSVLTTTVPLDVVGSTVPLMTTVSAPAGAFSLPTGTVTFADGANIIGASSQNASPYSFNASGLTVGSHTLTATYGGDVRNLASTSGAITVQVNATLTAQTITFGPLSNIVGGGTLTLDATATSGLAVVFVSNTSSVCAVSGVNVTMRSPGACSVTASQPGNSGYAAAPPVTQTFTVSAASQSISFDTIPGQILGVSPFPLSAAPSSGLAVGIVSNTPSVCRTAGAFVELLSAGTCSITASQNGSALYSPATAVTRTFGVSVAKPAGSLTATSASPIAIGNGPSSVAVGDFNGDGIPDLATANSNGSNVTILLGDGAGGFRASSGSPLATGTSPVNIVSGDFNGDGKTDLAVTNGSLYVFLGNGSGGFSAAPGSPNTAVAVGAISVGDFNGDGIQDLAAANYGANQVTILLGNGAGGFAASSEAPLAAGSGPAAVAVADFNGDGVQDLAVADYSGSAVTVLTGNGSGGFVAVAGSPFAVGGSPIAIAAGDFNADGKQDLALANGTSVSVLLGNGSGSFSAASGSPFALVNGGGGNFDSITIGDLNGDGYPDVAILDNSSNKLAVLLGNGSGGFTFAPGSPFQVGAVPSGVNAGVTPVSMAAGDFNLDGKLDIVTTNYFNGAASFVTVILGASSATTSTLTASSPLTTSVGSAVSLTLNVADSVSSFTMPTGTATFLDGATALGTAAQTHGPFTFSTSSLSAGSHALSASYGGDIRTFGSTSNTITVQVNPGFQTIVFGPLGTQTLNAPLVGLSATASSGLMITFTSNSPSVCTVSNATATLLTVGTCSITASQTGNSNYVAAASVTQTFTVSSLPAQTITFAALTNVPFNVATLTLAATATSGLPVRFASNATPICTVIGSALTLVSLGTCSVTASQAGNANYAAAVSVTQSFAITQGSQTITFSAPGSVTLPANSVALTATASSGLVVSFASTTLSVCTVSGTTATLLTAGTCTIVASQAGNANYLAATSVTQSFSVNAAVVVSGGGGGGGGAGGGGGSPLTVSPASVTISASVGGSAGSASITLSYQTQTQGAPSYSSNFSTNQGEGWISVTPATGTMTQASYAGFLYTYTATVNINADPTGIAAGSAYTGTVNFSAGGGVVSVPVTLNVSAQPAKFSVAPQSLGFSYQVGNTTLPATQSISVFSVPTGGAFKGTSSGSWLSVGAGGTTPGAVAVSVNVSGLAAGTYSGSVSIGSISVPVTLTVLKAAPPVLSVSPTTETVSAATTGQITVSNVGGGTLQFTASSDASWLKVTGSGSATSGSPASLAFSVDASSLTSGVYSGHITVNDSNSSASSVVTIVLTVPNAAVASIQLSKSGVVLTGVAGGGAPQAQTVTVAAGSLNWTTQVSTNSGGNWLTASGSGTSLSISASTTGLAAGQYYGSVNVVAANAANSPQTVSVELNVLAASASPGIFVSTGGVLLVGTASASQSIGLFNASSAAMSYSASVFTANGTGWLSVSPASGTLTTGANTVSVAANLSGLTGVQAGSVTFSFGDGSSATIDVVALVLSGGNARGGLVSMASTSACVGGKAGYLIPVFRLPGSLSSEQVSAATTVQVQVVDDCGHAVTSGAVQITFSNGDAAINLNSVGAGVWEATWVPANTGAQVVLQVSASSGGLSGNAALSALSSVTVGVLTADADAAPQPTGIANAASAAQAVPEVVAPGSYIAIYGTGLAGNGNPSAVTLPLPTTLNGTQMFLGGLPMPLLYAGAGQVNALVPEGIAPNGTYPLVVVRGAVSSVPVGLTVTELQPGVYTVNTSGSGIVTNALTGQLISASNPAHAGDYLVIYCTGLGALVGAGGEVEPGDGVAAPSNVVYHTTATVSATIGGVSAPVLFSGLTATFAGLYQVNLQVPVGVGAGAAVPVVLTAADATTGVSSLSNSVALTIQ